MAVSGIAIKVNLEGFDTLSNVLESMTARAVNLRPLMARFGVAMIASVHQNFADEGRPEKWAPLSASTVRSMQHQAVQQVRGTKRYQSAKKDTTRAKYEQQAVDGMSHKLLVRTGDLRQSISIGDVTNDSVEIGSSLPYARIHQLGGTIGPMTVKPRTAQVLAIPTDQGVIYRRSADIPERHIPARPYLKVQEDDVKLFVGLTVNYIREGVL